VKKVLAIIGYVVILGVMAWVVFSRVFGGCGQLLP